MVEKPSKAFVYSKIKILLDFLVEKPHTKKLDARYAEAGPAIAADEEEEEYARMANKS